MPAYVHADSKNIKKERTKIFSSSRVISTKIQTLFSGELVVYICMILTAGSLMLTDSYYKAYKANLKKEIIQMIEETKELTWRKETTEHVYLKMTSAEALMQKAKEMKMSVVTSDKFVKLD